MIDTHCHIDQYDNPIKVIQECEEKFIFTIGVTNLPSHFELGYPHTLPFKRVRLALGLHPLYASHHQTEFSIFLKNIPKTSYIGEIGLDFSRDGIATKEAQLFTFNKILQAISGEKKILSLHTKRAEKEVLQLLINYNIKNAIFHWYSGPLNLIQQIADNGYYFSINTAMIKSKSGCEIIRRIPLNRILTESDGPYVGVKGRLAKPSDVALAIEYLSKTTSIPYKEMEFIIENNFMSLVNQIR